MSDAPVCPGCREVVAPWDETCRSCGHTLGRYERAEPAGAAASSPALAFWFIGLAFVAAVGAALWVLVSRTFGAQG